MRNDKEAFVLRTLREKVAGVDLRDAATALGAGYDADTGRLLVHILNERFALTPELKAFRLQPADETREPPQSPAPGPAPPQGQQEAAREQPASYEETVVILNSLLMPGGRPGEGWQAFREMAAGHARDFRVDVEQPLAEEAELLVARVPAIANRVGGELVEAVGGSDLSIVFAGYPGVRLLLQLYLEEMEFPTDARVLFSAGSDHFLRPGCLEELGHRLAERLITEAKRPE
ncbi:MAG TPA: DUF3786 domain-containing protein [Thermoleophilia bacterium]|nr:DUF3786 domain-containing protein [Thermoleophilia bacterium]